MKYLIWLAVLLAARSAMAQDSLSLRFYASTTYQPVNGLQLQIHQTQALYRANRRGIVRIPMPPTSGTDCTVRAPGYLTSQWHLTRSMAGRDTLSLPLQPRSNQLAGIVIQSSRIPMHVAESPQHVELVQPDDIQEGTAESPSNIRELLSELSGTQIQQTSAVSATVDIRLEGLAGRYTQLLKDGFPLYGGLSGSLDVLQTPPLDLQQVEVMLGAGSTLYGPNAIAGFINLISKKPDTSWQAQAVLSQSQKANTAFSAYSSHRGTHSGFSLLVSANRQQAVDVNADGFSDLPYLRQWSLEPTLYWYPSERTRARLTLDMGSENRRGGDMWALSHGTDSLHPVLEQNRSLRSYYQFSLDHRIDSQYSFHLRNSSGFFQRHLSSSGSQLDGNQVSTYWEAYAEYQALRHQDLLGLSLTTLGFHPTGSGPAAVAAFQQTTAGVFGQDDWALSPRLHLESGLRLDAADRRYLLPRIALLERLTPFLNLRLGSGTGYMLPSPFTAAAEQEGYSLKNIFPSGLRAEQSWSNNVDVSFSKALGSRWFVELDQNFYQTTLYHGLIPNADSLQQGTLSYENAAGHIRSRGFQTQLHLSRGKWSLASSYSFTDGRQLFAAHTPLLLSPKGRWSSSLTYEKDGAFKAGLEAFYTGTQYLDPRTQSHPFWTFDAMASKTWDAWTLMLNVENFSNTLQSRYGPMYQGTVQQPSFAPVYGPTEGRVITLSLEWNLGPSEKD